jgi:hypothetical protein
MVLLYNYEEKTQESYEKIKVEIFATEKANHKTGVRKRCDGKIQNRSND